MGRQILEGAGAPLLPYPTMTPRLGCQASPLSPNVSLTIDSPAQLTASSRPASTSFQHPTADKNDRLSDGFLHPYG